MSTVADVHLLLLSGVSNSDSAGRPSLRRPGPMRPPRRLATAPAGHVIRQVTAATDSADSEGGGARRAATASAPPEAMRLEAGLPPLGLKRQSESVAPSHGISAGHDAHSAGPAARLIRTRRRRRRGARRRRRRQHESGAPTWARARQPSESLLFAAV
jgi:hypothetical protein